MSRNVRKLSVVAAGCLGIAGALQPALAVSPDQPEASSSGNNSYAVITDRNVFRLNPPPLPPPPPEPKPTDLPKYMLTGIVTIGDQTRALFALASKDAKESPTYFNLLPGEQQGELKVVKVDTAKREVAILNSGMAMTLSAASNSYASTAGTPVPEPGPPGRPRRLPGFPVPPPAPAPAGVPGASEPAGQGGAIIIGGNGNSAEPQANGAAPQNQAANYAGQNYNGYNGGRGGVSVAGGEPVNYGGNVGTVATPNSVPISLTSGNQPNTQTVQNWPPVQPSSPEAQYLSAQAQAGGVDTTGQYGGNSGVTVKGSGSGSTTVNGRKIVFPPMPPIPGSNPAGNQ